MTKETMPNNPMTQDALGASGFEPAVPIGRGRDFVQPDPTLEADPQATAKPSAFQDAFFADRAARKAARLSKTIASVAGTNADAAAANQALGAQVGVSPGIAERNADRVKRRADFLRINSSSASFAFKDPILADFMSDPKFLSVAHDDLDSLYAAANLLKRGPKFSRGIPGFRRGLLQREMFRNQRDQLFGISTPEQDTRVIEIEKELVDMPVDEQYLANAGELSGQIGGGVPSILFRVAEGAAIGAGAGLLGFGVGAVPMGIVGGGRGALVGFAEEAFNLEAGSKYGEMIKAGFDRETAIVGAVTYGAISASIEMLGAKVVTAPYRFAMRKAIATATVKTTAELVARPTAKAVIKSSLAHYFKAIAAETGTEVTQQILSIAVDEVALRYAESDLESRITTAEGLFEIMDEVRHVAEKVAKGMSILSAAGGGVHYVSESRAVQESERSARVFKEIAENTKGSKLQLRDPSKREAFIASQASAAGVDTVYMRATDLIEVLKQDPITDSAMDEVLPGVREQIADAQKLGGSLNGVDVTIPMSVFATRLAGTKLGDKLVGLMRVSEEAVSAKDLPAFIEDQKQRQKEAEATMAERLKTDGKWVAEAQKIESDVVEALVSAGRDPDAAKVEAKFVQAIVVTGAAREGITPLQWVAKNALPRIAGTKDAAQGTTSPAQQAPAQQINVGDTITAYDFNGTPQQVLVIAKSSKGTIKIKLADGTEDFVDRILTLQNPKDPSFVITGTELSSKPGVLDHSLSSLSNDEISLLIEIRKKHLRATEEAGNLDMGKDSAMTRWNQDLIALESEVARRSAQQAPAQGSFGQSQIAKMDSDYMAAVESGDVAEQQRMVDEATSSSGWYTAQHGTPTKERISVFGNRGGLTGAESAEKAFFFSDRSGVTDTYRLFKRGVPNEEIINKWIDGLSPKELVRVLTRDIYFNYDKLNDAQAIADAKDELKEEARKFNEEEGGADNYVIDEIIQNAKNSSVPFPSELDPKNIGQTLKVKLKITNPFYFTQEDAETFGIDAIVTKAIANGHDGIISSERVADSIADLDDKDPPSGIIYAVFNPEQIKSADPITRDESGKVVPLSRRFNLSSPNTFEQASRADLGLGQQAAFNEANYRPAVVAWAKEKFGDRTAPDGSSVWQNFTEWFGDSKVVDAEGKPLVVYHGTRRNFSEFREDETRNRLDDNGYYFTDSPSEASAFATGQGLWPASGNVMPVYALLKNPLAHDFKGEEFTSLSLFEVVKTARKNGHDGVIVNNIQNFERGPTSTTYIAFHPTQIKSAIANTGEFSETDPNILRQDATEKTRPKFVSKIIETLGLTEEEVNSTVLDLMTGKSKSDTFKADKVGGIKDIVPFLHAKRLASGLRPLDITNSDDQTVLAKLMAAEALAAIQSAGGALAWYDSTIRAMLAQAAIKYPELNTDRRARNAFILAAAVTSQGMNVEDNLKFTFEQYDAYRKTVDVNGMGQFPELGQGADGGAMKGNFVLINTLMKDMGPDLLAQFLRTPFTVSQLKRAGFEIGGELQSEVVLGSSVLGPKIGFGFFSNLSGNFDPVTMDMWFMRTAGRLAGTLPAFKQSKFDKQVARFKKALFLTGTNGIFADQFDPLAVENALNSQGLNAILTLAKEIRKRHNKDFKEKRSDFNSGKLVKSELVHSAITMLGSIGAPIDAPSSGGQRRNFRDVVKQAVALVSKAYGQVIANAAFQAIIWYPEQELYKALGAKLRVTSTDYAGAANKLLKAEGINGTQLDAAELAARKPRPARAQQVAGKSKQGAVSGVGKVAGEFGPINEPDRAAFLAGRPTSIAREWKPVGIPAGLSASEQARELSRQAVSFGRRTRKGVGREAWSYDSRRDPDGGRKRVLKKLGVTFTHEWTAGPALSVILAKAKVAALKFHELEQTPSNATRFAEMVEAAKKSQKHGAAVFVYQAKDYKSMRTFVSQDGLTGFAIKPDGDIVSVFSHPTAKGGRSAMEAAVAVGGKKLDAFDTILPDFYAPHGFRVVSRLAWDDSQAPVGWDKAVFAKFNSGEPDVVFMALDEQYFGSYSPTDGIVGKDYDDAVAIQEAVVAAQPVASGVLNQSAVPATFYSALSVEVAKLTTKSANAESWKQQIKGLIAKGVVKEKEVYWSGLDNWLDLQEGKITKENVQAFLDAGGVKVEVERLDQSQRWGIRDTSGSYDETYDSEEEADDAADEFAREFADREFTSSIDTTYLLKNNGDTLDTFADEDDANEAMSKLDPEEYDKAETEVEESHEAYVDGESVGSYYSESNAQEAIDDALNRKIASWRDDMVISLGDDVNNATKFGAYQLPGGTNYREALVTLPRQENTRSSKDFESSHWNQKNVLVHLRMNDRVDADGKKVLFVEEVQSDWGQAGREEGFVGGAISDEMRAAYIKLSEDRNVKMPAAIDAMKIIDNLGFNYFDQAINAVKNDKNWKTTFANVVATFDLGNLSEKQISDISNYVDADIAVEKIVLSKGYGKAYTIPMAPFVETTSGWLELGLKQIMLEAVNGGYDRVAFVDGDQSVGRYRQALTQAVDEIEIQRNDDGTYTYNANKGGGTIQREASVSANRINEVFGKAGSKQLLEQADANPESINTIASSDIEIGGEGMRKFYDTIVPQALNKMLKKLGGGKVENVNMITEKPVTQEQINAAERRRDFTESERLTAIYERQQLGRGISKKGEQQFGEQRGFTVTPALAEQVNQGLPLFQAAEGDARGSYDPVANLMRLGKKADASTFPHELAHWYLVNQFKSASNPTTSAQTKADADKTLVWFGIPGENLEQRLANWNAMSLDQQRKYHESFAYNWEIYLFEGRSPSVEMQSVFAMFKRWMTRVYISIRDDLNAVYRKNFGEDLPFLTDEIRAVFDRVLASEEQIQQQEAIDSIAATFSTQEESGMSNEEWGAYKAMEVEAHDQAVTDLTKASLRQMQWLGKARSRILRELQARNETQRKQVRSEVAAEVGAKPVYQAISLLKTGKATVADGTPVELKDGFKLNLEDVKKMVPAEDLLKFGFGKYGMVANDGMHPDIVAEMFGFKSGDELVLAILETKPLKEAIEEQTDKRMLAKYGGMQTAAELEAEVQKALHNEARARFVAVELRFLSKATQPVQMMLQAAKQIARKILGAKVIRSIRVSEYTSAEARSAKEASTAAKTPQSAETASKTAYTRSYNAQIAQGVEEAVAVEEATREASKARESAAKKIADHKKRHSGLTPAVVAIKEKQHQLIQHQLAKEAIDVKEEIEKAKIGFRKFFKTDERTAKTRDVDVVSIARSILAWYGFGKHGKSPAAYVAQLVAYNPALYEQLEPLITRSTDTGGSRDYRDLTVDEFRILRDSVEALWTQARRDKQIEVEGELLQLEDVVGALEKRVETIGVPEVVAGETSAPTRKERFGRALMHGKALLRRVEHWADATDGAGNKGGPFTRYIFRPIQKSIDNYRQDRNKYVKRFVDLLAAVDLPVGKIQSGELNYTFGNGNGGIGKAEVLGALLHTGNESNFRKLILGRRWGTLDENGELDTSKWDTFLKRMIDEGVITKADFDFVQAVWDLNEEIKPIAQKAHHSLFGYYFQEVEATPLETPFGTYRGGYVPAKTDSFIVRDAARNAKMEELESDFRNSMPSTGMGFTKARKEYNEYLSLDVRLVASHINDVLRFAHVQPAIKDVLRILKDRGFANRLSRIDATAIDDMLIPWLTRSARQSVSTKGMWASVDAFWRTVRSRTGMSIMFANVRNALQQTTGLFPASLKVESKYLKGGLTQYLSNPRQLAREVTSMSKYMESRTSNEMFDLQEAMNDLLLNPSKYDKVKDWSAKHAYFMQMAMQNMVDLVVWTGAYNQAIVDVGPQMSEAKAQAEAVSRADAAVRLTQGSMTAEGISQFEVGTPAYRIFVQFTGYFNMMANLNADEFTKVFRDLGWRGNKGKLFAIYLLGFALPALVSDAIVRTLGGTWDDDDDDGYLDDFAAWFFGSQIRAVAAMLPFGSSVATALTAGFTDATYDDRISSSPAIGALEASTVGVAKAAINVVDEDRDVTGKNVRDVLTLVTLVTGVPVSAAGKPIGYVVDVERGAIEPTSPTDFVRGLVTGSASEPSKNR